MPDNHTQNNVYESLIGSIGNLHIVNESIKKDKDALSSFTDYLNQNEAEICKFGKASGELCSYLDGYDFAKGFQMDVMRRKVETLHPLRLKLAKMGEEAKKLSAFPDRYGSKRAIEICRNLAMTCMERMSFGETGKVSELVEENIGKLLELQKKFASDDFVRDQINDVIDANKSILDKYKAYLVELRQYVSGFPHSGEDDLAVVKEHVEAAKQVEALITSVGMTVETIKTWCDRYNKGKVVARYATAVDDIYSKMRFADVDKCKSQLKDVEKQAKAVMSDFDKENAELKELQASLMKQSPDIWKEDNENLTATITSLLGKEPRKASFSLEQLKGKIAEARANRINLIESTVKKHGWLNRKKHKGMHNDLVSRYIASSEYVNTIEAARRNRNKTIAKIAGISSGIVGLIALTCIYPWILAILGVLAVIAIIVIIKNR